MFRDTFAPISQEGHPAKYDEPISETRTIQVKKEDKKSSVFARKTLAL
jgi:hypothetical protein